MPDARRLCDQSLYRSTCESVIGAHGASGGSVVVLQIKVLDQSVANMAQQYVAGPDNFVDSPLGVKAVIDSICISHEGACMHKQIILPNGSAGIAMGMETKEMKQKIRPATCRNAQNKDRAR